MIVIKKKLMMNDDDDVRSYRARAKSVTVRAAQLMVGVYVLGFRVQGMGFRNSCSGFRIQGLGFRV